MLTRFDPEFDCYHYNSDFEDLEDWHNNLLAKLIPDSNYHCIGYYDGPINKSEPKTYNELSDCEIIDVVTKISVNVESVREFITRAGYRILDIIYEPDRFHFFIKKVE